MPKQSWGARRAPRSAVGGGAFFNNAGIWKFNESIIEGHDAIDRTTRWLDQSKIGRILTGDAEALKGGGPVKAMLIQNTNPVTVANEATGNKPTTVTNFTGYYVIPDLPVGSYALTVELSGFKKFVKTGVDLLPDDLKTTAWRLPRRPYLMETSIPGVFCVGDARSGSVKRVASAVGEGSICVQLVHRALEEL